jgi:hypothetical protein
MRAAMPIVAIATLSSLPLAMISPSSGTICAK